MKKQLVSALAALMLGTFLAGCDSKVNNKARRVAKASQQVEEAAEAGATKEEVMAKQARLDSARKDLSKTWAADRKAMRNELNDELAAIDRKIVQFDANLKAGKGNKARQTAAISTLRKERATLTGLLSDIDQVTADTWTKTKKAFRQVKDGIDDRVEAIKAE